MTLIAHLTDPHLLEDDRHCRPWRLRARISYLSLGRPLDAQSRRRGFASALRTVRLARADHVVVTGDLTEDGVPGQFEAVAEELAASGLRPDAVTLVPGNHDIYSGPTAWQRALAGPLRPWAASSTPAEPVAVGGALIVPVSTLLAQPLLRSAGAIPAEVIRRLSELARLGLPLVIAQHHDPHPHWLWPAQWVDGLQTCAAEMQLLRTHPNAYVLHGHSHRRGDRSVPSGDAPRVFAAAAVVDSMDSVRLYALAPWGLRPLADDCLPAEPALETVPG